MGTVTSIRTDGPLRKERADAARNRTAIIEAADRLFREATSPDDVSMDDVATAAGVGKGTLFRRFGDRTTLIRSVFAERSADLTHRIAEGPPPLGPGGDPRARIVAVLDALVVLKLDNRHLSAAVEGGLLGERLVDSASYRLLQAMLAHELVRIVGKAHADFTADALIGCVRADLLHRAIDDGRTPRALRNQVRAYAERVLGQAT